MAYTDRYGHIALVIAMAGDLLVSFALSFFYSGYSNIKMSISALWNPNSPVRIPFNIWMFIEGLLFLLSLPALYNCYSRVSPSLTKTMVTFIAVFAIGACLATSFFSVNESKQIETVASKIHGVASAVGFMLFLFVPLLLGILSFKAEDRFTGITSIICFVIALAFFVLFVMSDKEEFSGTFISQEGLWQRLNLVFMYASLFIAGIRNALSCR